MSCNGGWGSEMLSAQMPPCPAVFGCYINGGGKNQPIFPELQSATEIWKVQLTAAVLDAFRNAYRLESKNEPGKQKGKTQKPRF